MVENINTLYYIAWLDGNLVFSVLVNLKSYVTTHLIDSASFNDDIVYSDSETSDNYQYYQTSTSPTHMDWTIAYKRDKSTPLYLPL